MKKGLFRLEYCFLPIACMLGALLGRAMLAIRFFAAYSAVSLFVMCADGAFCIDAARQGSLQQVDRRFWGSIVQILIGMIAIAALLALRGRGAAETVRLLFAALMACIEQLFVERLHAHNHERDALLLAFLQALLTGAAFGLDSIFRVSGKALAWAMMLGVIISNITLFMAPCRGFSVIPRCYARAPRALLQNLLYPAALAAIALAYRKMPPATGALAGWLMWRGARSVCRRSEAESAPLNFWCMAGCAAAAIAALWTPQLYALSICMNLALLCVEIVFARISWRNALGTALLIGVSVLSYLKPLPQNMLIIIGSAICIAAPLINMRHAFLKRK